MRLTGILLLFCVSIGTVSSFSLKDITWPSWGQSILTNPIDAITNKVCLYFAQHPDRAAIAIIKINETLQSSNETRQTFVLTINYINSPINQQKLIGGNSTCPAFFNGLENALMADLKNENLSLADTQQKVLQTLKIFSDILQSLIN